MVQAEAGMACAQAPTGSNSRQRAPSQKLAGVDAEALGTMAKTAVKAGGKQLQTLGRASLKALSNQYDSWRGSGQQGGDTSSLASKLSSNGPG